MMNAEKSIDYIEKTVEEELFEIKQTFDDYENSRRQLIATMVLMAREYQKLIISCRYEAAPVTKSMLVVGRSRCRYSSLLQELRDSIKYGTPKATRYHDWDRQGNFNTVPKRPTVDKFKNRFSAKTKKYR